MPPKVIYQGNIAHIERNDRAKCFIIDISLLPHCPTCNIDTYNCPHITSPPSLYSLVVREELNSMGKFLQYYAERDSDTAVEPYIKIFDEQGKELQKIIISSKSNGQKKQE